MVTSDIVALLLVVTKMTIQLQRQTVGNVKKPHATVMTYLVQLQAHVKK
jgi:hypothetical protein